MVKMMNKELMQYMLCGHGRCFSLMEENKKEFREILKYGCLNNLAFDLQCEGSRGLFLYNLAILYNDYEYFLEPAIEKFLSPHINEDDEIFNQLCDFIELFASDYGDKTAEPVLEIKYGELYDLIMTLKWSAKANRILKNYEYIAIVIIQDCDFERAVRIMQDMGAFFIRRRRADNNSLRWNFEWFWHCLKEKYGEDFVLESLKIRSKNSKTIRKFAEIMSHNEKISGYASESLSADEFIALAKNGDIVRRNVRSMSHSDDEDKIRLAKTAISESDLTIKANLLKAFTISRSKFPLEPELLIDYTRSQNAKLRETALDALTFLNADCIHEFALELLNLQYSPDAFELLINNYRNIDKKLLIELLCKIEIDKNSETHWHRIVLSIVRRGTIEKMPDEAIMFVYERSMCSCCRESAVSELIRRNLLTKELCEECLWDCNSDIREIARNYAAQEYPDILE